MKLGKIAPGDVYRIRVYGGLMKVLTRTYLLFFALFAPNLAQADKVQKYVSEIPAQATVPLRVSGDIFFRPFHHHDANPRRFKRCALIHGYGMGQKMMDLLFGPTKNRTEAKIAQMAINLQLKDTAQAAAEMTLGPEFIDRMAKEVCEEVYAPIQETVQTSLLEMVQRTEMFLKQFVCDFDPRTLASGQRGCALFGVSKGGAAVTHLMRRCMEGAQGASLLGERGCKNIGKIYSAGGVIEGVAASALVLGAKVQHRDDLMTQIIQILSGGIIQDAEHARSFGFDLTSDYEVGKTNPGWLDLSPVAPMENDIPVLVKARQIPLHRTGWFRGEYTAAASRHLFNDEIPSVISSGTRWRPNYRTVLSILHNIEILSGKNREKAEVASETEATVKEMEKRPPPFIRMLDKSCATFGSQIYLLHTTEWKPVLEKGVQALLDFSASRPQGNSLDLEQLLSWDRFQVSDGLVDYSLSLDYCWRALKANTGLVKSCRSFENPALNHFAMGGSALELSADVVGFFTE